MLTSAPTAAKPPLPRSSGMAVVTPEAFAAVIPDQFTVFVAVPVLLPPMVRLKVPPPVISNTPPRSRSSPEGRLVPGVARSVPALMTTGWVTPAALADDVSTSAPAPAFTTGWSAPASETPTVSTACCT